MSPELRLALLHTNGIEITVDHRTDIFSLGMVMIEILCGELLSQREFICGRKRKSGVESISPHVCILQKCIAEKASVRYPTAQHLSDDTASTFRGASLVHTPEPSWVDVVSSGGIAILVLLPA